MRVCKAGLCFSGPTAYLHKARVIFNKKDYLSNEQAFQCTKTTKHDYQDLAKILKDVSNSYDIKVEASDIVTTTEWESKAPVILWDLFYHKMSDNLELLECLIQTAPLLLIKVSIKVNINLLMSVVTVVYCLGSCTIVYSLLSILCDVDDLYMFFQCTDNHKYIAWGPSINYIRT